MMSPPLSFSWRISLPTPCLNSIIASGTAIDIKLLFLFCLLLLSASKYMQRALKIGSVGVSKGSLSIIKSDKAEPGTSTPAQKDEVAIRTALPSSLKRLSISEFERFPYWEYILRRFLNSLDIALRAALIAVFEVVKKNIPPSTLSRTSLNEVTIPSIRLSSAVDGKSSDM